MFSITYATLLLSVSATHFQICKYVISLNFKFCMECSTCKNKKNISDSQQIANKLLLLKKICTAEHLLSQNEMWFIEKEKKWHKHALW
jgi:hypothetical protein